MVKHAAAVAKLPQKRFFNEQRLKKHYLTLKVYEMEKLQKVARRILLGILFSVGMLHLFLYIVSFFSEELSGASSPLQNLVIGLLLTSAAFFFFRMKVTYQEKGK